MGRQPDHALVERIDVVAEVRRNRRRAGLVAVAAAVNVWLLCVTLWTVAIGCFVVRMAPDTVGQHVPLVLAAGVVVGSLVATQFVTIVVRRTPGGALRDVKALPATEPYATELRHLVEGLAIARGIPMSAVRIVHDRAANALVVGRRPADSVIVVTTGLLECLTRPELEAVLAVQVCAVATRDAALGTVTMGLIAGAGGARNEDGIADTASLSRFAMIARLLRRLVDRSRTNVADVLGAETTRNPAALISALEGLRHAPVMVQFGAYRAFDLWFVPPTVFLPGCGTATVALKDRIALLEREFGVVATTPA